MKVRYHFVNGDVSEVEVPKELGEMLVQLDRQEHNNNQTETRRHVSLDMVIADQGMQFGDEFDIGAHIEALSDQEGLRRAVKTLKPQHQALLWAVYTERRSIAFIANERQVDESSIREQLSRIYMKLCKDLS